MGSRDYGLDILGGIKRKMVSASPPMTRVDMVLRPLPDFPDLPPVFHCRTLRADLNEAQCAANWAKRHTRSLGCLGCKVHCTNEERASLELLRSDDAHERQNAAAALSCIRCRRSSHTAKRHIGRLRLTRGLSLCVSCLNRELEVVKKVNSKGAIPRKWAAALKQTTMVIRDKTGKVVEVESLRTGYGECLRWVERTSAGTLLAIIVDGKTIGPEDDHVEPEIHIEGEAKQPKPKRTTNQVHRVSGNTGKRRPQAINDDGFDSCDEFGGRVPMTFEKPTGRAAWLPAPSPEEDEAYRASFERPDTEQVNNLDPMPWDGLDLISDYLDDGVDALVRYLLRDDGDLTGERFGHLCVLERDSGNARGTIWKCECTCGNIVFVGGHALRIGKRKSCGCFGKNAHDILANAKQIADHDDSELMWGGKTLAHWSKVTATAVEVLAHRMAETGRPFLDTPKAIRPAPSIQRASQPSVDVTAPAASTEAPQPLASDSEQQNLCRIRRSNRVDISGQRFGKLLVVGCTGSDAGGNALWQCNCDCGRTVVTRGSNLRRGNAQSCGCARYKQETAVVPSAGIAAPVASPEPKQADATTVDELIKVRRKRIDARRIGHPNADNLTGKRFELLEVLHRDGATPLGHATWRVRCDCGAETSVRATDLKRGKQVSCGCFADSTIRQRVRQKGPLTEQERSEWNELVGRDTETGVEPAQVAEAVVSTKSEHLAKRGGRPLIDIVGQRFRRLVVTGRDGSDAQGRARWACRCDCGRVVSVVGYNLRNGKSTSCGCYQAERARETAQQYFHIVAAERSVVAGPKRPRKGKAARRAAKAQRRAEREQQANATKLNTKATGAAIGSRALLLAYRRGVADIIAPRS